ncbi:hypothetical protein GCM10011572_51600 [Pseudoduganella buxea]|uniref:Uncharacterized protein n=1 Tax=Pseudoduganella buxea TaxID=1949069 RepID=A0ABQ1LGD9_9BURK|nr:hypothetical protein GCM10011572_51600 [Pseudoduganella buxea]
MAPEQTAKRINRAARGGNGTEGCASRQAQSIFAKAKADGWDDGWDDDAFELFARSAYQLG